MNHVEISASLLRSVAEGFFKASSRDQSLRQAQKSFDRLRR